MRIEINLQPEAHGARAGEAVSPGLSLRERLLAGRDLKTLAAFGVGGLAVLLVAGLWLWQRGERRTLETAVGQAIQDSTGLAARVDRVVSLRKEMEAIQARIQGFEQIDQDRYIWLHILDDVSNALPEVVWLDRLSWTPGSEGLVFQVEGNSLESGAILEFLGSLEASPYLGEVQLLGTTERTLDGRPVKAFTLSVRYSPPGAQP